MAVGLAFAVLGPIGALVIAWVALSPDAAASTLRGGGAGAVGAALTAAGDYLADEWRAGGPVRRRKRTARRDRQWAAGGVLRQLLAAEHGLIIAWRAVGSVLIAVWRGGAVIPAGAKAGAQAAREHRARTKTGDVPVPADGDELFPPDFDDELPPEFDPQNGAGERGGRQVIHTDDMDLVIGAHGPTCPRCGTPWQPVTVRYGDGTQSTRMRCTTCGAHRSLNNDELPAGIPVASRDGAPSDSGGRPATGQQARRTGDGMTQTTTDTTQVGGSELNTTDEFRAEITIVATWIEQANVLGGLMHTWQTNLPDAYQSGNAAGGPRTKALDEAVAALSEAGADAVAFGEALGEIRYGCDQADALGEDAASMGADGHTRAYAAQ